MNLEDLKNQWDRVLAALSVVAGGICLIAGILGVNHSVLLAEQTRYITAGGLGGVVLVVLGATLWISADLRDEWRKLDRIERALAEGVLRWSEGSAVESGCAHQARTDASDRPGDAADNRNDLPRAASRS
jgi:hypothetical protein